MLQALSRRKGYHIDVITFTYQLFKKNVHKDINIAG